ncbi:MAG TPA: hypothetical protein VN643_21190 [Pyrinomonadaceae bacterium]|nr:hypothetical protein [Pyrinomonadaceae bacterium]
MTSIGAVVVGRLGLFGGMFDAQGLGKFALDSGQYFRHATTLAGQLRSDGMAAWWADSFPLHIKLYSLSIAALGPLLGSNILAVEPLNLIGFLAVLIVVCMLGTELFERRVGLAAAVVVAIWPTFLLHSTQVLKDQFFISGFLGLILICARLLIRSLDWRSGLLHGLIGGALLALLWIIKADFWEFLLLVLVVAFALLAVRFLRERTVSAGNVVAAFFLIVTLFGAPQLLGKYRKPNPHPLIIVSGTGANQVITINRAPGTPEPVQPPSRTSRGLSRLREKLAWARYLYANYPGTTSAIDSEVRLESWGQVVAYVPRALEIGLFAPFPETWLGTGAKVGRGGRILSGLEMMVMYVAYVLVGVALWRRRSQLPLWLLLTVSVGSVLALSLVTANLGALYRLRYPFWMLLIVLGTGGWFVWREKELAADYADSTDV